MPARRNWAVCVPRRPPAARHARAGDRRGARRDAAAAPETRRHDAARGARRVPRPRARPSIPPSSILFQRGVYPADAFAPRKAYGLTCMVTSDERLAKYLATVLEHLEGTEEEGESEGREVAASEAPAPTTLRLSLLSLLRRLARHGRLAKDGARHRGRARGRRPGAVDVRRPGGPGGPGGRGAVAGVPAAQGGGRGHGRDRGRHPPNHGQRDLPAHAQPALCVGSGNEEEGGVAGVCGRGAGGAPSSATPDLRCGRDGGRVDALLTHARTHSHNALSLSPALRLL